MPVVIAILVIISGAGPAEAVEQRTAAKVERIGNISDVDPPEIEILVNRNGVLSSMGAGGVVLLGDLLSIRQWCRKHPVHSLVIVNTKFGRRRLDCDNSEVILTDRGPQVPPPPPGPTNRTAPTITAELRKTLVDLAAAQKEVQSLSAQEVQVQFSDYKGGQIQQSQAANQNMTGYSKRWESQVAHQDTASNLERRPTTTSTVLQDIRGRLDTEKARLATLCQNLWTQRNTVLKSHGYCLREPQAIASFGNAGCVYTDEDSLPLPDDLRNIIKSAVQTENLYCR